MLILKYYDLSILQFLTPTYPTAMLSIWTQNCSTIQRVVILQKRPLEFLICNQEISSPLFKQNFILKFQDKICLENIF